MDWLSSNLVWIVLAVGAFFWLSSNLIWIALAVGAFFVMTRMGGCGMGHAGGHHHDSDEQNGGRRSNRPTDAGTTFDPVSRHAVVPAGAPASSIYHGRAFYFENREDREVFESDPDTYLKEGEDAGQPLEREHEYVGEHHHRHGCC